MNKNDITEIAEYIMESGRSERIVLAAQVVEAFNDVLWQVAVRFWTALRADLEKEGYKVDEKQIKDYEKIDWSYFGLPVRKDKWPDECWLTIEARTQKLRNFILGCRWEVQHRNNLAMPIQEQLSERFEPGAHSDWWPWYKSVRHGYDNWSSVETLRKITESLSKDDSNGYRRVLVDDMLEVGTIMDSVLGNKIPR